MQRMTQDVSRLSEPALFQLAARAPPEPYQRMAPEEITPFLLAETALPDWVHVGTLTPTLNFISLTRTTSSPSMHCQPLGQPVQ